MVGVLDYYSSRVTAQIPLNVMAGRSHTDIKRFGLVGAPGRGRRVSADVATRLALLPVISLAFIAHYYHCRFGKAA